MDKQIKNINSNLLMLIIFLLSVLLGGIGFPAHAKTFGDDFNTDTLSLYNSSPLGTWSISSGYLIRSTAQPYGSNSSIIQFNTFSYGKYSSSLWLSPYSSSARYNHIIFGAQTNESIGSPLSVGNQYVFRIGSGTTANNTALFRTVAGSNTLLSSSVYPILTGDKYDIFWNNTGISFNVNDVFQKSYLDNTFSNGYAGVGKIHNSLGGLNVDYIFINESITNTDFICSPLSGNNPLTVTCNQTGNNYNDIGVQNNWYFSDGTQATGINITHTFNTGFSPFTITLVNSNVAGTDTKTKTNYITVNNTIQTVIKQPYPLHNRR